MNNGVYFVVGAPGVGKTSFLKEVFRLLDPEGQGYPSAYLTPKPKWTVWQSFCAAGHYSGGTFDGADTVPYNGVDDALAFWLRDLWPKKGQLTFLDGDRFSHEKVVSFFRGHAVPVHCIQLVATPETLAARRAARGSTQNPSWMKGRETKAVRFAQLQNGTWETNSVMSAVDSAAVMAHRFLEFNR